MHLWENTAGNCLVNSLQASTVAFMCAACIDSDQAIDSTKSQFLSSKKSTNVLPVLFEEEINVCINILW